jgi:hypothetical protein
MDRLPFIASNRWMQRLPSPAWGDLYAFAKKAATPRIFEMGLPLGDHPPRRTLVNQAQGVGTSSANTI